MDLTMGVRRAFIFAVAIVTVQCGSIFCASAQSSSVYMDFRNQKITDILYSLADLCGESVLIDETVVGNSTFHFEDADFEHALNRFAEHCQLYVEKRDGKFYISKVSLSIDGEGRIDLSTENVLVEPLVKMLSRKTETTIMYDALPNAVVTIRVKGETLENILNLVLVKLPGFGLERIASGFYLSKTAGSSNVRKNVDVYNLSNVNEKFSITIQHASFQTVLASLFKKANKEFSLLAKSTVQLEDVSFSDKDFDAILHLILEQASCDYSIGDGGVYYIFEIQKKDVVKNLKESKVLQLKYIGVDALLSILPADLSSGGFIKADKNSNSIVLTGSSGEIGAIEKFIQSVDIPQTGKRFEKFELRNLSVKDAVSLIPKSLIQSDIIQVPGTNFFVVLVTDEGEKSLRDFVKVIDGRSNIKSVELLYIRSDDLIKNLPPCVTNENVRTTMDQSKIFFVGSDELYQEFMEQLKEIDRPVRQIKYQILVIQRQKTTGLNWSTSLSESSTESEGGTIAHSALLSNIFNINFDVISQFGMQFAGSLNAELGEGKSHVLADTTLNGISGGTINFSNTNTYRYRDIIADKSGELYTSTTREIASGLTLTINGWVSGDGMITVNVDALVSKQGSSESSGGNGETTNPPSTSEKKVSTCVRTRSGEPVIIGGLYQQETDITEKRVPFLGAIPVIGNLFKSKTVSLADTEFIIYLVPSVEIHESENLSVEENIVRLYEKYFSAGEAA